MYCQSNLDNVNCQCFGQTAGHILSQEKPQVRGMEYADKTRLARDQAMRSC